jgi:hypothetical protein
MMIGVAQVIGMKPTLRSCFSGGAVWAKTSVAPRRGKTAKWQPARWPHPALQKGPSCAIVGQDGPHHGGFDHAVEPLLLRGVGGGMNGLRTMPPQLHVLAASPASACNRLSQLIGGFPQDRTIALAGALPAPLTEGPATLVQLAA